jgi:hypothetical protein
MARRRRTYFFETFNEFVDRGIRHLTRSEIVAYLILLRDRKPDGTARTSFADIGRRGGISRRFAIHAVHSLIKRGVVEVIRRGGRGIGPSTYCVVLGGVEVTHRGRTASEANNTKLVK